MFNKLKNIFLGNLWSIFHKHEDEEWKRRMEICNACDSRIQLTKNISICNKCGCVLMSKCKIKEEKCDLNKW